MNEAYLGDRNAVVSAMAVGSADVLDTVLQLLSLRRATEQPLGPRFLNESVLEAFAAVQQAHVALAEAVTAWDAADAWSTDGALNASAWLRNKLGISSPTAHTILNFACKTSILAPTVRDAVMDRVAEAERLVARGDLTPELTGTDRELLASTLQRLRHLISAQNPTEQLLHGEPHPGNIINTANGPVFVDLETCCRGPIEFDLAHAPQTVSALYRGANQVLLSDCRQLVLAMVAVWRWEPGDQLPNGKAFGRALLRVLRVFCGANHGSRSFSSCTASRWTPPASPTFRYSTSSSDRLALGANFMFRGRGFGA